MYYKKFENTVALRVLRGEEIIDCIKQVCEKEGIKSGIISGLGAVDHISLGLYKVAEKKYYASTFDGEREISGLVGNVSTMNGETYLHIHGTFSDVECNVKGGHLREARVSATAEIFIQQINGKIERELDQVIGLNMMKFE